MVLLHYITICVTRKI